MRRTKLTPEQRQLLHRTAESGVLSLSPPDPQASQVGELQAQGLLRKTPGQGASLQYVLTGAGIAALRD